MDKYQRILEAAVKVFAVQGFFASTIAQIAREAGVADGTIYLYFKNKEDILVQFYQYKAKHIFERFREQVGKPGTAEDKLRRLIYSHLMEFQNDPNMAIVYQAETHQNYRMGNKHIKEMSKLYRDIITEIIELGQTEGTIRRDLYLGLVKRFINGAIGEVINAWLNADRSYDLISMTDPLMDLFIRGIGANSTSKPVN